MTLTNQKLVLFLKKLIIFLGFLFSYQAYSRFYFDGHAGFGFTPDQDQQNELRFKGVETGVRFGPTIGPLVFGVDASYGWTQSQFDFVTTSSDIDMQKADLGGFVGLEFLKLIRVWGAYYIVSQMSFDYAGSPKLKGTASGAGVGLTVLPYVSINGEVKFYNMNKFSISGSSETWSGDQKVKPIEIIFSIGCIF